MEKYSKAVSEMYSQFKQRETHQMGKYIGRLVYFRGEKLEVVGYSHNEFNGEPLLIVDASQIGGWRLLDIPDVVFKECEGHMYVSISDLID